MLFSGIGNDKEIMGKKRIEKLGVGPMRYLG
jgi:hypothetical protein